MTSPAERASFGKAARAAVPRSAHAIWEASPARIDPLVVLAQQDANRVPELVPLRYARMLASPLAFYRGAAAIMASDLAQTPVTGIDVQACGDAHLSNFGVFASPERNLVFDINDFDETHSGAWEWDVKRLAASLAVAAREQGFGVAAIVRSTVRAYRTAMSTFAPMRNLEVWYAQLDADQTLARARGRIGARAAARTKTELAGARASDSVRELSKLTALVDGVPRIVSDPPLIVPIDEIAPGEGRDDLEALYRSLLRDYRTSLSTDRRKLLDQFELVDLARKVVGIGSVGTDTWILLLLGRDARDPLVLQAKEAQSSVLEQFFAKSAYGNSGRRVVEGQRLMQATSDIFLGWQRVAADGDRPQRDYYVRQLRDWKGSADITKMRAKELTEYGELCGWTLARAHARSGDRIAIASYLGSGDAFDQALASFANAYADQNERDYQALGEAVRSGRVDAGAAPSKS